MSTILVGAVQVVASLVQTVAVEKFGRKPLLIASDLFVCLSMVAVGIFFRLSESCPDCQAGTVETYMNISEETISDIGWLPLVGLMIFVFFFMIGLGPVGWLMNVELMPMEARVRSRNSCQGVYLLF